MAEVQEWKVYFEGNFWSRKEKGEPCKEIPVKKEFLWSGDRCCIPAIYACSQGLVVDICREIPTEKIGDFLKKWGMLREERACSNEDCQSRETIWKLVETEPDFSEEERRQIERENPFTWEFRPHIFVNGKELEQGQGCSTSWNPWLQGGTSETVCAQEAGAEELEGEGSPEAAIMKHYGLDLQQGWTIWRYAFSWGTENGNEELLSQNEGEKNLCIKLQAYPEELPGPHFTVEKEGDEIRFCHPISGKEHVLKVVELGAESLKKEALEDLEESRKSGRKCRGACEVSEEPLEWPTHFKQLKYIVTPELPNEKFRIFDCAESDAPRRKANAIGTSLQGNGQKEYKAASIGIIGGSDGPTSVFIAGKGSEPQVHLAFSAMHFEPVSQVEWRMVFYEKLREDITITIQL